jgi:uncharacterized repeat protein (TIGR01451 family)
VTTIEGLHDEKCVVTQITEPAAIPPGAQVQPPQPQPETPLQPVPAPTPRLALDMTVPPTASVSTPITYQIAVSNPGTAPATNVVLSAAFDRALEHETHANPVELNVGTLMPGEVRNVALVLTPRSGGRLSTRVTATATGNLRAEVERTVNVLAAQITVTKTGPKARYVDQTVSWDITVANAGDIPVSNVVLRDQLPAEVAFLNATGLGQQVSGQVVWNLGNLAAREQKAVQVSARCAQLTARAVNVAVATADLGLQERAEAVLQILAVPAYSLDLQKFGDPVPVGGKITYRIAVTNTGSLPGNQVEISATVPKELQVTNTDGPTKARLEAGRVIFPSVDNLQPKQTLNYSIECQALQPGDVRFRVELRTATVREPVVKEESTTIFAGNGTSKP